MKTVFKKFTFRHCLASALAAPHCQVVTVAVNIRIQYNLDISKSLRPSD